MFKGLLKRCLAFRKVAGDLSIDKVYVAKNSNPFFKELSELKSFDERVELAESKYDKLGEGSSRAVFEIDDDLILKVSINEAGLAQCRSEMSPELQTPCFANVVAADPQGKWLVMVNTETMSKEDFKRIIGFGFDMFMNCLFYAYNNESDNWKEPREYDEIRKLPLFKCLGDMVVAGSLLIGDISKPSSFGVRHDKVYLRDGGLSKQVFLSEYKTDSSSSSSTPKTSET